MFSSLMLLLASRNAVVLEAPSADELAAHEGEVVKVTAWRATMPWQHPVRDLDDQVATPVDLVLGTQTIAYSDEPLPCRHQPVEILARVTVQQASSEHRLGGPLEEAQLEVLDWSCVASTPPPQREPRAVAHTFSVKPHQP